MARSKVDLTYNDVLEAAIGRALYFVNMTIIQKLAGKLKNIQTSSMPMKVNSSGGGSLRMRVSYSFSNSFCNFEFFFFNFLG